MFATNIARSIDSLERELAGWQETVAQARFRQVELLRQLDVVEVAAADGCRTMVDWVAFRLDVPGGLPGTCWWWPEPKTLISTGYWRGEVGLERAVAMIRLCNTGASEELMAASFGLDLAGLWRLVATREKLSSEQKSKGFSDRFLVSGGRPEALLPAPSFVSPQSPPNQAESTAGDML